MGTSVSWLQLYVESMQADQFPETKDMRSYSPASCDRGIMKRKTEGLFQEVFKSRAAITSLFSKVRKFSISSRYLRNYMFFMCSLTTVGWV